MAHFMSIDMQRLSVTFTMEFSLIFFVSHYTSIINWLTYFQGNYVQSGVKNGQKGQADPKNFYITKFKHVPMFPMLHVLKIERPL